MLKQYEIKQRWLVVKSEERKKSDSKKLAKKIEDEKIKINKEIRKWNRSNNENLLKLKVIVSQFIKKLKYHKLMEISYQKEEKKIQKNGKKRKATVYQFEGKIEADEKIIEEEKTQAGRFVLGTNILNKEELSADDILNKYKEQQCSERGFRFLKDPFEGKIEADEKIIEEEKTQAGRFVLGTNILNKEELSADDILNKYKEQQCSERGFRFLKDPLFFADSIFVKNVHRVETMAMMMGLCLLVYSIGQRLLRQNLESENEQVKNQVGKPTKKPTLKWIFQIFQGIHYVIKNLKKEIFNLTEEQKHILKYLSPFSEKYYVFS